MSYSQRHEYDPHDSDWYQDEDLERWAREEEPAPEAAVEPEPEPLPYKVLEPFEQPTEEHFKDIPDVHWKDDIAKIRHPKQRDQAIRDAEGIKAEEDHIWDQVKQGKRTENSALGEIMTQIHRKKVDASFKASLASVDMTPDHLADMMGDYDLLAEGNPDKIDALERVGRLAGRLGDKAARKVAQEYQDQGKLSQEDVEAVLRKGRLAQL